jgi:hypothetical protein
MVQLWTNENIKTGIELFVATHSRMPTARDFDRTDYLPSARQIQRNFGGIPTLRQTLGYGKLDFTKGDLRKIISTKASSDGILAEEYLEPLLIAKFGEPYVHTQKRYNKGTKNRYDFFIYAKSFCFGIDVFSTGRAEYISTNVRHKIQKYKLNNIPVIFVALGTNYSNDDIARAEKSLPELINHPTMKIMNEQQLLTYVESLDSLRTPEYFVGI